MDQATKNSTYDPDLVDNKSDSFSPVKSTTDVPPLELMRLFFLLMRLFFRGAVMDFCVSLLGVLLGRAIIVVVHHRPEAHSTGSN